MGGADDTLGNSLGGSHDEGLGIFRIARRTSLCCMMSTEAGAAAGLAGVSGFFGDSASPKKPKSFKRVWPRAAPSRVGTGLIRLLRLFVEASLYFFDPLRRLP